MKVNVLLILLMIAMFFGQLLIPIGDGRTHLNFYVIIVAIVAKILFGIKLFGIDIPVPLILAVEGVTFGLSSVFFFSSAYRHSIEINWLGYVGSAGISLAFVIMVIVESVVYIYEEVEVVDDRE
jgi:hypothetical protein